MDTPLPPNYRRRRQRSKLYLATGVSYVLAGIFILSFRVELAQLFGAKWSAVFIVGLLSVLAGVAVLLFAYLRGDFTVLSSSYRTQTDLIDLDVFSEGSRSYFELKELAKHVESLQSEIARNKGRSTLKELSSEERESLLLTLKSELTGLLASDVLRQLETKYSSQIAETAQVTQIRKGIQATSERLRTEIAALSRRGNLNLVIGTLTTIVAVGLLAYLVLGATINYANVPDLLSHFIPRISIAVFIEIFSFFFLKLYKSSLRDIKYFQNELTNIEMRGVALETALLGGDNKATEPIIGQLIRTDRNPIGPSTLPENGKEATYLEPKELGNLLDKLSKLLNIGGSK